MNHVTLLQTALGGVDKKINVQKQVTNNKLSNIANGATL